jgi:hypothetical protein
VSTGIAGVVSFVQGLPGKIRGAVSGAAGWLVSTGEDIIRGLISGIGHMAQGVLDKVKSVIGGAIPFARKLIDGHSPSRVFMAIGQDIGAGLAIGIDTSQSGVTKSINKMISDVTKAFPKAIKTKWPKGTSQSIIDKWNKQEAAAAKKRSAKKDALTAYIEKNNKYLSVKVAQRDAIADKLKDANDHLAELQKSRADVVDQIGQAFAGTFQLINDAADAGLADINNIIQRSRDAVSVSQQFAELIKGLAKKGIDPGMVQELAAAGPKAGFDTARALMDASADQVKELNANYKAIAASGQAAGDVVAGQMYDTGIAAAQAIADGFAAQKAQLENTIMTVVNNLAAKIQQALAAAMSPVYVPPVPKLPVVKKPTKTPAKKPAPTVKKPVYATKAVAAASVAPVAVTVNTGVVVDKRGLVSAISSAFNEVSAQLGRPITMNVR